MGADGTRDNLHRATLATLAVSHHYQCPPESPCRAITRRQLALLPPLLGSRTRLPNAFPSFLAPQAVTPIPSASHMGTVKGAAVGFTIPFQDHLKRPFKKLKAKPRTYRISFQARIVEPRVLGRDRVGASRAGNVAAPS